MSFLHSRGFRKRWVAVLSFCYRSHSYEVLKSKNKKQTKDKTGVVGVVLPSWSLQLGSQNLRAANSPVLELFSSAVSETAEEVAFSTEWSWVHIQHWSKWCTSQRGRRAHALKVVGLHPGSHQTTWEAIRNTGAMPAPDHWSPNAGFGGRGSHRYFLWMYPTWF